MHGVLGSEDERPLTALRSGRPTDVRLDMRLTIVALTFGTAFGQGFDAASVKPAPAGDLGGSTYSFQPGGVRIVNGTLRGIVQMAYDLQGFEIYGGPGWMDSARYDIDAKLPSEDGGSLAGDRSARIKELRGGLQHLLADRFQLQVHREPREIPEYALVIGKNGPKLVESAVADSVNRGRGIRAGCGQMTGTAASMANLAYALSRQLRRPVLDRTGLAATYDFELEFAADAGGCSAPAGAADDSPPDALERPSIFTALQERLGLKLEPAKGAVPVMVIDRAEKPAAN